MALEYPSAREVLAPYEPFRAEIRNFIARTPEHVRAGWTKGWAGYDRAFTKALGAQGWIGISWPRIYGGGGRSELERYVLLEELLVAGAPVSAHWLADRQVGPLLLALGTQDQKEALLPSIASGELTFAAGLSEPDSGSDLASIRTAGTRVPGGWRVNGRKIWSSNATRAEMMLALVRTEPGSRRHDGLSQFLIPLDAPGVVIRPIQQVSGDDDFAEVTFDDVFVDDGHVVGVVGEGWRQVTMELGLERSGPERFLASFQLIAVMVEHLGTQSGAMAWAEIGRLIAHLATLRSLSVAVAARLDAGEPVNLEASVVKDLGAMLDQTVPEVARRLLIENERALAPPTRALLDTKILMNPLASIQGGTRQVLRSIIARGMGLR